MRGNSTSFTGLNDKYLEPCTLPSKSQHSIVSYFHYATQNSSKRRLLRSKVIMLSTYKSFKWPSTVLKIMVRLFNMVEKDMYYITFAYLSCLISCYVQTTSKAMFSKY